MLSFGLHLTCSSQNMFPAGHQIDLPDEGIFPSVDLLLSLGEEVKKEKEKIVQPAGLLLVAHYTLLFCIHQECCNLLFLSFTFQKFWHKHKVIILAK